MFVKLLVLGRPGSGKTTASYRLKERGEENGWFVTRSRDYDLLHNMFIHDVEQKRFRPTQYGGFEIIDFSVLDEALFHLKKQVKPILHSATAKEMLIIEFARDDYRKAFEILGSDFLLDTNILFVDASVNTCIQRIHQRIVPGLAPDKHFVSDSILKGYYSKDDSSYMKHLARLSSDAKRHENNRGGVVQYIDNIDSLKHFYNRVDYFCDEVMELYNRHSCFHTESLLEALISNSQ